MKNKLKLVIAFTLGAIIFGSIGVYATSKYMSKDISYTKKDGTETNVNTALNDLYAEINNDLLNRIDGTVTRAYYVGNRGKNSTVNISLDKGNYYVFTSEDIEYIDSTVYDNSKETTNSRMTSDNFNCTLVSGFLSSKSATAKYNNLYMGHTSWHNIYLCSSNSNGIITYTSTDPTNSSTFPQGIVLSALKIN